MRLDGLPDRNCHEDFTDVRLAKRGKRRIILRKLEPRVFQRYDLFLANLPTLELVPKRFWRENTREALIHCYSVETVPSAALLDELERATRPEPYRCPYCLMRQPKTWDHFLAKEDFPEYSTLAPNLVRACSTCNTEKRRTFTEAPRQVVNPYHDPIPTSPLLWCDASIDPAGKLALAYYIYRDPDVPDPILDLFERHFVAFKLEPDMTIEGSSLVGTFVEEIVQQYTTPLTAEKLDAEIERKLGGLWNYPTNSWEVATFEGLCDCAGLLQYINSRIVARPVRPPRINRAALRAGLLAAKL
ncbi:hypothetical protein HFO49_26035 [Rhizobium leguminosarum]|uniref:hypothetical protein n=1 Tax=Rhizobium leguminosarum TaxID=384 RepID=UPI001C95FED6|nr:hypothetical protein [Rhizobium leguminosarum]MBY5590905.1 hypothetical protein [Rhizobium leguminosarum]